MDTILSFYNEKHKHMDLVFFEDCLQHVARVMRTITLPRGNNLLVGVGGSGKKSITQLAAYTAQCGVFEITLSRGYDEVAFRDDLKVLELLVLKKLYCAVSVSSDTYVCWRCRNCMISWAGRIKPWCSCSQMHT